MIFFTAGEAVRKVFPDRPVVDIPEADAIFHTVYDLGDRYQVPGRWALDGGRMAQRAAGTVPHWMGVFDDVTRALNNSVFRLVRTAVSATGAIVAYYCLTDGQ